MYIHKSTPTRLKCTQAKIETHDISICINPRAHVHSKMSPVTVTPHGACEGMSIAFEKIKVCTAYEYKGEKLDFFPTDPEILSNIKPIYEEFEGWDESTYNLNSYEKINEIAKVFISKLENILDVPIDVISTGPSRNATIIRNELI